MIPTLSIPTERFENRIRNQNRLVERARFEVTVKFASTTWWRAPSLGLSIGEDQESFNIFPILLQCRIPVPLRRPDCLFPAQFAWNSTTFLSASQQQRTLFSVDISWPKSKDFGEACRSASCEGRPESGSSVFSAKGRSMYWNYQYIEIIIPNNRLANW